MLFRSPKGSLVYAFDPSHSVRFTYNEAFQVPNYSEFFLQTDAAAPVNLSGLNAVCAQFGVNCGFGVTRVMALGNKDLKLERIKTVEVGYKGILAGRALLTLDYYKSRSSNFVTDLLPQLGTPLGRVNPNFGPWQGPANLPAAAAAAVRALAPGILSNNVDGSNILAAVSYANFGDVDTQGLELGLSYYFLPGWKSAFNYSWFDFTVKNQLPGFDTLLLPNSPAHTASFALGYTQGPFEVNFSVRHVNDFAWGVGPFQGTVLAYASADVTAHYNLTKHLVVGLNVANLFDNQHWESFGGDLLRRRALTSLQWGW